jgi:ribosomal protein L16 Arg81 hydroxylase
MMGSDTEQFLDAIWRRRTSVVRNCLTELRSFYSISQFMEDYLRADYHAATLVIDTTGGARRFTVPTSSSAVSQALKRGLSVALQALQLPGDWKGMPEKWKWMNELHSALCRYFLPGLPTSRFLGAPVSAVDVFCTLSPSTTGGHHDAGDVFFLPLEGEKVWTVEYEPDLNIANSPYKQRLLSGMDLEPANETTTVTLYPGDCLYMPPHTYHRVRSEGPSLAVSFGLPAYNAIHLLAYQLSSLAGRAEFTKLLPSAPENGAGLNLSAKAERRRQLRGLLEVLMKQLDT